MIRSGIRSLVVAGLALGLAVPADAQLSEARKQAHEQLLDEVLGAVRRARPAISRAI